MSFNLAATLDYYYCYDTHADKGWYFDTSGELVSPGGERYPIAESVIHSQSDEVVVMPSTPPRSDCGQSDDITPGTENARPQQQQQRRKRSRRHRGRKSQGPQQKPEPSTSTPMPTQKKEGVDVDGHDGAVGVPVTTGRMRSLSLSARKSTSSMMITATGDKGTNHCGTGTDSSGVMTATEGGDHRRHSEPCGSHEDAQPRTAEKKQRLYKTELCRNWEELDHCRYGDKCQYAHGLQDLRDVERHPKYKTQVCRTYYQTGSCPYGTRCTFRHLNEDSPRLHPLPPPAPSSTSTSSSSLSRKSSHTFSFVLPTAVSLNTSSHFDNNNVLPNDAESLLPPGLLIDLDEPPPVASDTRPRSSIWLPCFPSNDPFLVDNTPASMWKQSNRTATL